MFKSLLSFFGGDLWNMMGMKLQSNRKESSFFNNRMVREELAPRGFWGRVQGVGLIGWVNTRPMVCGTPSARSVDAREARFIGEFKA